MSSPSANPPRRIGILGGTGFVGRALREQGGEPLYSTSWDNKASVAVARKLGLVPYGEDIAFSRESGGLRGTRDRMAVIARAMESTAEPDASGFVRYDWAEAYEAMLAENG